MTTHVGAKICFVSLLVVSLRHLGRPVRWLIPIARSLVMRSFESGLAFASFVCVLCIQDHGGNLKIGCLDLHNLLTGRFPNSLLLDASQS